MILIIRLFESPSFGGLPAGQAGVGEAHTRRCFPDGHFRNWSGVSYTNQPVHPGITHQFCFVILISVLLDIGHN